MLIKSTLYSKAGRKGRERQLQKAKTIFHSGTIMTMDPAAPQVEAIAVASGRILAAGALHELEPLIDPGTKSVSLGGRFVMPGLIESHTHAIWGACRDLFEVYVGYQASLSGLADALRTRLSTSNPGTWISGGPWRPDMAAELDQTPRDWLDALAPSHPVALYDTSKHALWCNSIALKAAGLDDDIGGIAGGIVERDGSGKLTGMLAEAACSPVRALLHPTPAQLRSACDYAIHYFNSLGYTGFKDPMADESIVKCYAEASDEGRLTLHTAAHLTAYSPLSGGYVPLDELDRQRDLYSRPNLHLGFAKLFLDGVAPARTASFLDPYLPGPGYDPATHDPDETLLLDSAALNALVCELDARSYVVKMHAVGDNAVRQGLDAIAAARQTNGASGLRHEIAHCTFVSDADLPRFASLNAVAEMSPKLWFPNAATAGQRAVLPDATLARMYRVKDLQDEGAEIVFGSDWPAAAPDADPWSGMAGLITRRNPQGAFGGAMNPQQAVSLEAALPYFTTNAARAIGLAGQTGVIKTNAWADFIVLSTDIRAVDPSEIPATEVLQTFWKGQAVYEQ